jgi:hypothetical protein
LPSSVEVVVGPPATPAAFVGVDRMYLAPHPPATGTVEHLLGRPGMTMVEWTSMHSDIFR